MVLYREDEAAERMHRLNKNMERETIVVRIITVVTLMYLPATFVSTLFSTDIVKYQDDNYPQGKFSNTAMNRWLEVTLPLTCATLLIAWAAKKWAEAGSEEAVESLVEESKASPLSARIALGFKQWARWDNVPMLPLSSSRP